jgi:hypothetical protein
VSRVLNALVICDLQADSRRLEEINAPLAEKHGQVFANDGGKWYGGPKRMEASIYGAAFNHVPVEDVVAAVRGARWDSPGSVKLLLMDQNDDEWTVYEFAPRPTRSLML